MAEIGPEAFYASNIMEMGPQIVNHIGCQDCHDPKGMGLRVTRPALALLCIRGTFLGSLPQVLRGETAPIYQRIPTAPPFVLALLLLLSNLAWGVLRHLTGGLGASSLFLFNHINALVVVAAGLFGVGDMVRLDLWAQEGWLAWTGTDGKRPYEPPFAVDLNAFTREFFPPQLTILDAATGKVILPENVDLLNLRAGFQGSFFGHELEVREVTQSAPWSMSARARDSHKSKLSVTHG